MLHTGPAVTKARGEQGSLACVGGSACRRRAVQQCG